jgi:phosphoribosylformimino-5-aminoimidazole carboxamide ribotide isomerase
LMDLYPAIDLRGGKCVRLVQGDFGRETVYGEDPVAVARAFAAAGAPWIHVVDLDAARRTGSGSTSGSGSGYGDNRAVVASLVAAVAPVPVQVGGGVRDGTLLEAGVARVVVGSLAVSDPGAVVDLASRYPGRVAVGLDHRDGLVRVHGWEEDGGRRLDDVVADFDGVSGLAALVVTDISRDGMLTGPDLAGLSSVLAQTSVPVIASGGVGRLADLSALAALSAGAGRGLAGVIVGKALYDGRFELSDALKAVAA